MADSITIPPSIPPAMEVAPPAAELTADSQSRPRNRGPPLNQIYALPAPIRTFPLPSFYPSNPISLFHLVYTWMKQVLSPPPAEPSIIHTGIWDPDSRSVHITDPTAVRAFWEQGFYGKGNLSRSEPNWLKREQIRRGAVEGDVSEQRTALRREERRQVKWERARTEQEALERTRREEAELAVSGGENSDASSFPPALLDSQPEPELSASESKPRDASNEDTLRPVSPVEAIASTSLDVTEIEVKETVVMPSNAGEEAGMPLNGVAKAPYADDPPYVQVGTRPSPAANQDVETSYLESSSSVIAVAPVLSKAPLLSKAPVGPLEQLALPNCAAQSTAPSPRENIVARETSVIFKAPVGPLELLALPNSAGEIQPPLTATVLPESLAPELITAVADVVEASLDIAPVATTLVQGGSSDQAPRSRSPVGPLELLALPNSLAVMHARPAKSSEPVNGINNLSNLTIPKVVLPESSASRSPVGPLELLALPNSLSALRSDPHTPTLNKNLVVNGLHASEPHHGPNLEDGNSSSVARPQLVIEDDAGDVSPPTNGNTHLNGHTNGPIFGKITPGPIMAEIPGSKHALEMPDAAEAQPPKRRKSVRFSATVESTTFLHHDPPSPDRSVVVARCKGAAVVEAVSIPGDAVLPVEASAPEEKQDDKASAPPVSSRINSPPKVTAVIENKEHLQLSAEEAFFLAYGIGALSILDPDTKMPIPREKLLGLFRSHSYFPPRQELQPSDPFLVHYAVYHHFRSLGWVPRHGIKFGVDWMLYTRGPVFDHAEFGLIVMPSYSHSWWKENGIEAPRKSWHWLHGVNRVLSHVLKSLVLVYVDVPPPHIFDAAMAAGGVSAALKEYKVREFMVRRWSSNRNR